MEKVLEQKKITKREEVFWELKQQILQATKYLKQKMNICQPLLFIIFGKVFW